jgi:hypothetical protein
MDSTADLIRGGMHPAEATTLDRNDAIQLIREALKRRSGKTWSVTGGRGTGWGWIRIQAPPARRVGHKQNPEYGDINVVRTDIPMYVDDPDSEYRSYTSEQECRELAELFGLDRPVHCQGLSIPAASDYRRWYVAAALGKEPIGNPQQYWD